MALGLYACRCGTTLCHVPGLILNCCATSMAIWSDALPSVSPDILDPDTDPDDKDTTMTTIPAPEAPPAHTLIRHSDTLIARDGDSVGLLLERAAADTTTASFVQKARKAEQTGAVGLYLEAVSFTAAGTPFSHMKFFVVGGYVYVYNRSTGDARANWRSRETPDVASALLVVQTAIDKPNVKVFGHPVLVELTPDDVSTVEAGQIPPARFRGEYRIQRDFGKYDFEMPVVSAPIPAKLQRALDSKRIVNTPPAPVEFEEEEDESPF